MHTSATNAKRAVLRAAGVAFGLALAGLGASWAASPEPAFRATVHSSLRVFRVGEVPNDGAEAVRLSAARGETESFQLAVVNRAATPLGDVRIAVSGLTGVKARPFAAAAVHVPKPGRSGGMPAGHYYDLLRPSAGESVPAGAYLPYWIDLQVADDAPPGVQNGQLQVATSAGVQALPVCLQVRAFRLPRVPTLKLAFACGLSWMEAYYGKPLTRQQIRAAQSLMLEHRLGPVPMWSKGGELFDDEAWLKHCLANGMNVVLLSCSGQTDEQIARSLDAIEPRIDLLRRLGALERTYLFGYDEITMHAPEGIPAMRKAYEQFHKRHPEIRRINTSQPDPRLADFVDIFVVPTSRFTLPMAAGRETWWYSVGADNLAAEPDFRIDFPPAIHRGFFLADWKAGVLGHLYWAVQREWPANKDIADKTRPETQWRTRYQNIISKAWVDDNGGGNLFYPDGVGGMLPTPRVKRIRDGVEDYEYLVQLRAAVTDLERHKPQGWQALAKSARQLLAVPDEVVHMGAGWREGWNTSATDAASCNSTSHPSAVHAGRQALRMLPTQAGLRASQDLPARSGKTAVLAGWIKTDDLVGEARLVAEYVDGQGRVLQRVQSEAAAGSTRKFLRREAALPAAPATAKTLRLTLTARSETQSNAPREPIQKAFFDDLSLRIDGVDAPIVNAGFEAETLRVNTDPAPLLAYRERVADCLERCRKALPQ